MARKVRVFIKQASQHIILKSIDSITLFKDDSDYIFFIDILKELSSNIEVNINSYVLMPTYFEFISTPKASDTLSRFMQSLGRKYVGYFNKKYNRTGTLWEGRYKSSLIEDTKYLFDVMRYIESLPKSKRLVSDAIEYKYSSIHKNLLNKQNSIINYHHLYKKLANTQAERNEKYSSIFYSGLEESKKNFISNCLEKQLVTGSIEFIKNLEQTIGMSLISKNRGRPKKENIKKGKNMYKNLVVLDKEKHKELKINPLVNLNFAKQNAFVLMNVCGQQIFYSIQSFILD